MTALFFFFSPAFFASNAFRQLTNVGFSGSEECIVKGTKDSGISLSIPFFSPLLQGSDKHSRFRVQNCPHDAVLRKDRSTATACSAKPTNLWNGSKQRSQSAQQRTGVSSLRGCLSENSLFFFLFLFLFSFVLLRQRNSASCGSSGIQRN
jgi:hypothetical protein